MTGKQHASSRPEDADARGQDRQRSAGSWGRDARTRLAAEVARERAAQSRRRKFAVTATVAFVLAAAAAIGVLVGAQQSTDDADDGADGPLVRPPGVTGTAGTVIDGRTDASPVLSVYEDFRCPYCREVEKTLGPTIRKLTDSGRVRVEYHIASFLDGKLGGHGSRRAANAAACAEAAELFRPYHDALFAAKPDESDDTFANRGRLLEIADTVPGLHTPAFEQCVNGNTYAPWVHAAQVVFGNSDVKGTPTVRLDGAVLTVLDRTGHPVTPAQFRAQIDQVLGAVPPVGP